MTHNKNIIWLQYLQVGQIIALAAMTLNNTENSQLLADLKIDSEAAFATIFQKYSAPIFANILKLNIEQQNAEDILQEVFIELWNARLKIDPSHSIGGWLFTTSFYKSMSHLKKNVRESIISLQDEWNELPESDTNTHIFEKGYTQKIAILSDAIEQLSPKKKQAYTLSRVEGKSYGEIAISLSITEATAREYVKSASASLKKAIRHKNPNALMLECFLFLLLTLPAFQN